MKRFYEIVVIFVPDVSEEKLKKDVDRIKNIIKSNEGEVLKEEHWGNKKLAYEIKKFNNGVYHFILCTVGKNYFIEELKKFLLTNDSVLRYGIKKVEKKLEPAVENIEAKKVEV
ncbi:MAG: 30S ribosomal protein S6 [Endomicrobia bacterium]|nr:30S ribosomal protein S6 [Endomicrobiia bacterium]